MDIINKIVEHTVATVKGLKEITLALINAGKDLIVKAGLASKKPALIVLSAALLASIYMGGRYVGSLETVIATQSDYIFMQHKLKEATQAALSNRNTAQKLHLENQRIRAAAESLYRELQSCHEAKLPR